MDGSQALKNNRYQDMVKTYLELAKVKITIAVTITTLVGFILAAKGIDGRLTIPILGLFILACGSAALNHYQEKDLDSRMNRTKHRPIPSGKVTVHQALFFAVSLVILGSLLLYAGTGMIGVNLGLLALIWYNIVYTYLKKVTAFAVIPGALIGAIPPMIGYIAGQGDLWAQEILGFSFFIFIWQIPHFWLLLLMYGKEYEEAGFPTLNKVFHINQIRRITYVWIVATALIGLALPLYMNSSFVPTYGMLAFLAGWMIFSSHRLIQFDQQEAVSFKHYFLKINFYALIVMIIISLEKIFFS